MNGRDSAAIKTRILQVTSQVQNQRVEERGRAFLKARDTHSALSRRSGDFSLGRNARGELKDAREPVGLRMFVRRWYVRIGFMREDKERLADHTRQGLESLIKHGMVPRKQHFFHTHILIATRVLMGIRSAYEKEIENTEIALRILDELNVTLATKKTGITNDDIDDAVRKLSSFDWNGLSRKQVAVKRIIAREKLWETVRMLKECRELDGGERVFKLMAACAKFTALRSRLGQWRDSDIAGIVEYNHERECSLRMKRDIWLFSQLSRFAHMPERVHEFCELDLPKMQALRIAEGMVRRGERASDILSFLQEKRSLFRMEKGARNDENVDDEGKAFDPLKGHYSALEEAIRERDRKKAVEKVGHLRIFINANKPGFILDELKREPDPYLADVVGHMERAVGAFSKEDFRGAREGFRKALAAMSLILYPV
ncbi:MAG: hypothetical protein ABII71_06230 [Candidatus Micrarchaeota archaeon]